MMMYERRIPGAHVQFPTDEENIFSMQVQILDVWPNGYGMSC